MISWAKLYASWGWRVFPVWWVVPEDVVDEAGEVVGQRWLCACGNPLCDSPGKHPLIKLGRGMVNASSDEATVEGWWRRWPEANVALATGDASGVIVVDCDLKEEADGELELAAHLALWGLEPPETLESRTGGLGKHKFLRSFPGARTATAWLPGVDVRANGGYVLLPPSRHVSGRVYTWLVPEPSPAMVAPAGTLEGPLRGARSTAAGHGPAGDAPTYDYREAVRTGPRAGYRDDFFNRRAFELRKADAPYDEARAEIRRLWELTEQSETDPFTWETALGKLDRVWAEVQPEPLPAWNPYAALSGDGPAAGQDSAAPGAQDGEMSSQGVSPGTSSYSAARFANLPRDVFETDVANAERFVARWGADVRYSEGGWFVWNGSYWQPDALNRVQEMGKVTARAILAEAVLSSDPPRAAAWAKRSMAAGAIAALLRLASSDPAVAVPPEVFDPDPLLLAVANGVIDLRTGQLVAGAREQMITRASEVAYDPAATSALWDRFLHDSTAGDADLAAYLRRAAGYTLTGLTTEEVFFIIFGPKGSGKSTFVDALETVLGPLAMHTQADTFLHTKMATAPKDELASMRGRRMLSTIELPEGGRMAESLVKQMTGGDKLAGRHLYRDRFEFRPSFKLWIATNHAPKVTDDAMWRRLRQVPFPVTVPPDRRDPAIKLQAKDPGSELARAVLAWAVRGCLEWRATGLGTADVVELATEEYREEQNVMQRFLEERCEGTSTGRQDPDAGSTIGELFEAWSAWAEANREYVGSRNILSARLVELGYWKVRRRGAVRFPELRVRLLNAYGL